MAEDGGLRVRRIGRVVRGHYVAKRIEAEHVALPHAKVRLERGGAVLGNRLQLALADDLVVAILRSPEYVEPGIHRLSGGVPCPPRIERPFPGRQSVGRRGGCGRALKGDTGTTGVSLGCIGRRHAAELHPCGGRRDDERGSDGGETNSDPSHAPTSIPGRPRVAWLSSRRCAGSSPSRRSPSSCSCWASSFCRFSLPRGCEVKRGSHAG